MIQYNRSTSSGTFNGKLAGTKISGSAIAIGRDYPRVEGLSVKLAVTPATSGITITPQWEVCNTVDGTYVATTPSNGAANVILGTGTTTIQTVVLTAPPSVYGWQYARVSLVVGVQTGTTNDLYTIGYSYRQRSGGPGTNAAEVQYNRSSSSGVFTGVASADQVNGTALKFNRDYPKHDALSALVTVLAETNSFTIAPKWEVSDDNTTFLRAAPSNNAAAVVIATGTSGADSSVSAVVTAPDSVYGWQYARLALVAGGTTGASADTYSIGYNFRRLSGVER